MAVAEWEAMNSAIPHCESQNFALLKVTSPEPYQPDFLGNPIVSV
jgi:hypothetical protein